jgi:hypothetical protein
MTLAQQQIVVKERGEFLFFKSLTNKAIPFPACRHGYGATPVTYKQVTAWYLEGYQQRHQHRLRELYAVGCNGVACMDETHRAGVQVGAHWLSSVANPAAQIVGQTTMATCTTEARVQLLRAVGSKVTPRIHRRNHGLASS